MFYTYNQNNSGGSFHHDDKITLYVIVEADSPDESDTIAEDIGIYFNGCDEDIDCPCCGDRWCPAYDGKDEPLVYGESPEKMKTGEWGLMWTEPGEVYCRVFYKDGTVKEFVK